MMHPDQEAKIRNALALIQEAQTITYSAAQQLCSFPHPNIWNKVCRQGDALKALWHQVENIRVKESRP